MEFNDIDNEFKEWEHFNVQPLYEEPISAEQEDNIDHLLNRANFPYEVVEMMRRGAKDLKASEAKAFIKYLLENQVEPIGAGFNYDKGDIQRKLKNEI